MAEVDAAMAIGSRRDVGVGWNWIRRSATIACWMSVDAQIAMLFAFGRLEDALGRSTRELCQAAHQPASQRGV